MRHKRRCGNQIRELLLHCRLSCRWSVRRMQVLIVELSEGVVKQSASYENGEKVKLFRDSWMFYG